MVKNQMMPKQRMNPVWLAACIGVLAACTFPRPEPLAQCTSAADCHAADKPFCIDSTCVASCASNNDCTPTSATPLCDTSTGACVACLDDSMCSADKPVCDATGACRGCGADDECPSGVCLEADGTCAEQGSVVFVSSDTRAADLGDCPKAAPCRTIAYALTKVVPPRTVISVVGGSTFPSGTTNLTRSVYIDANGTQIRNAGVVFAVSASTVVTLANLDIVAEGGSANDPPVAVTVGSSGSLRLYADTVIGEVRTMGGTVQAYGSTFTRPAIVGGVLVGTSCVSGTLAVRGCVFQDVIASGTNCQTVIEKTKFDMIGNGSVDVHGGFARIENNLILAADEGVDSMRATGLTQGSVVRFNSIINTGGTVYSATALNCDNTVTVTSNIFAYNSTVPLNPECHAIYSLFDAPTSADRAAGTGNQTADAATFFVDRSRKDFHLAADSPGRGKAQAGLGVSDDLEGRPRPAAPDIGAYQHP